MKLSIFEVDAFADVTFAGNPAAVVPLESWLDDDMLQAIAEQNNLSETAFYVELNDLALDSVTQNDVKQNNAYQIRWFTPTAEVDLCGHATLAAAHVLIAEQGLAASKVKFSSRSGPLEVEFSAGRYTLNFPIEKGVASSLPVGLEEALDTQLGECFFNQDYLVTVESQEVLASLSPDFTALSKLSARGVIVTAPGEKVDFVCRFFAPAVGVNEDPVTGSAFTKLTPYWSSRLGKSELSAKQISSRGGNVECALRGDRVLIIGQARTYLRGVIEV